MLNNGILMIIYEKNRFYYMEHSLFYHHYIQPTILYPNKLLPYYKQQLLLTEKTSTNLIIMKKNALKLYGTLIFGFLALVLTGCKDQRSVNDADGGMYPPATATEENFDNTYPETDTLYHNNTSTGEPSGNTTDQSRTNTSTTDNHNDNMGTNRTDDMVPNN